MVAILPTLREGNTMQIEFLGTIETILETLRAEGIEVEEINIEGVAE